MTGGARRLGRALVLALADAGANVVINYNRSAEAAERTAEEVTARGRRAVTIGADVSSAADVRRLVEETERAFGGLDILVNSAALFDRRPFQDIAEEDWDRVLGVNLKGPFMLAQRAESLLRRDGGVIINIADLSGLQPWPSYSHHAISKAGLLHMTRVLARALAPDIRVNAITPGTVLPAEGHGGEDGTRHVSARAGSPADVADALLYLVRAEFTTGENLLVDGGRMLL